MSLEVDEKAKEIALRRWVLPECLYVPIAAVSEEAITRYIGEVVEVLSRGSPNHALLVRVPSPPPADLRLPIWEVAGSKDLFAPLQVWVHIHYTRYRSAYKKAFPHEDIATKVLSHTKNRRMAGHQGFQYVRLTAVSRGCNSSSAFSEQWGVTYHGSAKMIEINQSRSVSIAYADLSDLMLLMNLSVGGGVMDTVNQGQKLVSPL